MTKSSNFNQALWLGISALSNFLLAFLSSAILSRYFPKDEYGTYKQIMFVHTTLQVIFAAGLQSVFPYFIPRLSMEEGKTLVRRVTWLLVLLGGAFSLTLYVLSGHIAILLNNEELSTGLKLFSLAPLFTLPAMGVEGIYTALRRTKFVVVYQSSGRILILLCAILPVILFNGTYKEAVVGWTFASFLVFLLSLYMKGLPYKGIIPKRMPSVYRKVFQYSLPLMGASIVGMFYHSGSQFFISRFYGSEAFAEFSNGYISVPIVAMVMGSIRGVLLPLFSSAAKNGNMAEAMLTYKNSVKQAVKIVFPILVFCFVYSQDLMCLVFGDAYIESSTYFRYSLLRDFGNCLPFLPVMLAFGKSKFYFYVHLFVAVLLWIGDTVLVCTTTSPQILVLWSAITEILLLSCMFVYVKKVIGVVLLEKKLLLYIGKIIIHLSVIGILSYAISMHIESVELIIRILLNAAVYFSLVYFTGKILNVEYYKDIICRLVKFR